MKAEQYRQLVADGKSNLELTFAFQISQERIPQQPVREHRFCPPRRWRFDFAWTDLKLAIELEGGTFSKGKKSRHTTGSGFNADCEKYNTAALMGWTVLRFDAAMVNSLEALNTTLHALDLLRDKANEYRKSRTVDSRTERLQKPNP